MKLVIAVIVNVSVPLGVPFEAALNVIVFPSTAVTTWPAVKPVPLTVIPTLISSTIPDTFNVVDDELT